MESTSSALWLTFKISGCATLIVLLFAVPLGYLLSRRQFPGKLWLNAFLVLPMVLPPTAVGYLLLSLLADAGPLGRQTLGFDPDVLLTWKAGVLAAATMSFPIVIRTVKVTFDGIDPRLEAMARTLGHGRLATFRLVTLPLGLRGLSAAAILGFMRGMGEFGATVMIAGNIPGRTQTLALAIFSADQAGRDAEARVLLGVALIAGLGAVLVAEYLGRGRRG
ncbi:MAG: molybdate ABC transporter permease subunit [Myxococcales bacterium]|nr:molybdate ABC transporter permease subunit [Myxococcales bacterium]